MFCLLLLSESVVVVYCFVEGEGFCFVEGDRACDITESGET